MTLLEIKNNIHICSKCNLSFNNKNISLTYIEHNPLKYIELCNKCRRLINCKICEKEFYNKSGQQTCSKECAEKLKKESYIKTCGAEHNFSKKSKSREKWETKLLETEGVKNNFARELSKDKIKKTLSLKYGENIINSSQILEVKEKKKNTLKKFIEENPLYFKECYAKSRKIFLDTIGYDPRIRWQYNASKESMLVFNNVIDFCINEKHIDIDNLFYGDRAKNKKEYFINTGSDLRFYDFTIRSKKIIIEYNGSAWHPDFRNNKKILEWKHPITQEGSKKFIDDFNKKIKIAEDLGFKVLVIWDTETIEQNVKKCKEFINSIL